MTGRGRAVAALPVSVYVERGARRVFAGAIDWPGWARSGRDERAALEALLASAPRYAKAVARTGLGFVTPRTPADLHVVERVAGDATTDFGAPGAEPTADRESVGDTDLARLLALIEAAWRALDEAARAARGKTLAKGPRGGGRPLAAILEHVREAERAYLAALGAPVKPTAKAEPALTNQVRTTVRAGLATSARGEIPPKGPRGGVRWRPRRFARRLAWHALDHAWEIEDRTALPQYGDEVRVPQLRAQVRARVGRARSAAPRGRCAPG